MLCVKCGVPLWSAERRNGIICYDCKGEEKMEANGRVRLNITKNSRGYGWDMTIEQGNSDDLKRAMYDTLQETQSFKTMVEEMAKGQHWY